jgi:hypothetical protein
MDMMVSNYENVIKDHNRSGSGQSHTSDIYMTVVYYVFSFLLFLATPVLKAYVSVAHILLILMNGLTQLCRGDWNCESCAGFLAVCTAFTFRERLRVLAGCVYLFAILIIYQTLMAAE